jgi:hypothetical protein
MDLKESRKRNLRRGLVRPQALLRKLWSREVRLLNLVHMMLGVSNSHPRKTWDGSHKTIDP